MKCHWPLLERYLVALIAMLFCTPLCLTVFFHCWTAPLPDTAWLRNETLAGLTHKPPAVPFSWPAVWSGQFQKSAAAQFNREYAGREWLIRWTSEASYRLFKRCALGDSLVFGKNDVIFQDAYLLEYCFTRTSPEALEPLVRDLRKLQDACEKLAIGFVVLITPSKASILTESLPPEWLKRHDPRPRAYDQWVPLLQKHGIHFVDGHALVLQAKSKSRTPVFPKGGAHWGEYEAWLVTNALVDALHAQGKDLQPINHYRLHVSNDPMGLESDILDLMNLAVPWHYPVTKLKIRAADFNNELRPWAAIIGGSFAHQVAFDLSASEQFSHVDEFYYYRIFKSRYKSGGLQVLRSPVGEVDFDREIFGADCLVLESNEEALDIAGPPHSQAFVADALRRLALGTPIRRPPLDPIDDFFPCEWGKVISFHGFDTPLSSVPGSLSGFWGFEESGTRTGATATVRLSIPPATKDVLVEADVSAPEQPNALIKIYVNGTLTGTWTINRAEVRRQHLLIPHASLSATGRLALRFEISNPSEPGSAKEAGKPGLRFAEICLLETPVP